MSMSGMSIMDDSAHGVALGVGGGSESPERINLCMYDLPQRTSLNVKRNDQQRLPSFKLAEPLPDSESCLPSSLGPTLSS